MRVLYNEVNLMENPKAGNEGVISIAKAIANFMKLNILNLNDVGMSLEGCKVLFDTVLAMHHCTRYSLRIYVEDNPLSSEGRQIAMCARKRLEWVGI